MKKAIKLLHTEFNDIEAAVKVLTAPEDEKKLRKYWDDEDEQDREFDVKDAIKSIMDRAIEHDLNGRAEDSSAISLGERGRRVGDVVAIGELVEGNFNGQPFYGWQILDKAGQPAKRRDGSLMILGSRGLLRGLQIEGTSDLKAEAQKPLKDFYTFVGNLSALKVVAKADNGFGGFNYLYTSATL